MLGGHFHMGRKSKYSADFKLMIIHEAETLGITRTSRLYSISEPGSSSISTRVFRARNPHIHITHIPEDTCMLIEEYQKPDEKLEVFAIRHRMRDRTRISRL